MVREKSKPIRGKRRVPRFKSVEAESAFWDRHEPLDYGTWERIPYKALLEQLEARSQKKVSMTLRVEPELIKKLKRVARKHGLRYQALARELLWRTIDRLAQ